MQATGISTTTSPIASAAKRCQRKGRPSSLLNLSRLTLVASESVMHRLGNDSRRERSTPSGALAAAAVRTEPNQSDPGSSLCPCRNEVPNELFVRVRTSGRSPEQRAELVSELKTRSARVAVQRTSPVLRSRPSNVSFASEVAFHTVRMSSRLMKKSLVNASGFLVKTPNLVCPKLVLSIRMPPTSTVAWVLGA